MKVTIEITIADEDLAKHAAKEGKTLEELKAEAKAEFEELGRDMSEGIIDEFPGGIAKLTLEM